MRTDIIEQYYRQYYRAAVVYSFSLCGKKEQAEDIAAQAFERALLLWDEDKPYFKAWLLTVCRNLWLDGLRRDKHLADRPPEELPLHAAEQVEDTFFKEDRNRQLYAAMLRLQAGYREILVCHYFCGLPLAACADLLHITENNAKTRICRARARLKTELEESGYEL